jgi:hypothetical protein
VSFAGLFPVVMVIALFTLIIVLIVVRNRRKD